MPSEPQRLRALEQANAIRLARAELKRRVADGDTSVADVILTCPDAVRRWTIGELLMSQRRWGITRCRKFLERNGISEIKAIGAPDRAPAAHARRAADRARRRARPASTAERERQRAERVTRTERERNQRAERERERAVARAERERSQRAERGDAGRA